jgi:anthranilate synthase component 1
MRYYPPLEVFAELAQQYTMVPVYRQLTGDTLTPVTAFGRLAEGEWSFLFESVVGGERVGRYSFLGSGPFLRFEAYERRVRWQGNEGEGGEEVCADPLRRLEEMWSRYRGPHLPELPRFCGGIVGYAGYDTVRYVERLPQPPPDDRGLPDLSFGFYDRMVIFDHVDKTVRVVAHARIEPGMAASRAALEAAYARAGEQVDCLVERLQQVRLDWPLRDIAPRSAEEEEGGCPPASARTSRRSSLPQRWKKPVPTSMPAMPSKSCSASASRRRPRPAPSTSTAPCAWSALPPSCSICAAGRPRSSGRRRRSCAGWKAA